MATKLIEVKLNTSNIQYRLSDTLQFKLDNAIVKYRKELDYLQKN